MRAVEDTPVRLLVDAEIYHSISACFDFVLPTEGP